MTVLIMTVLIIAARFVVERRSKRRSNGAQYTAQAFDCSVPADDATFYLREASVNHLR
ncbi:hypothetical protein [Marinobacter nanhaiticus]|uniref:hypothetical protein n=1 Tax=Marinobacter nanhaiticus TaxID=1305740 RepID=UPI0012B6203A|nr:hypothetical protein [Marinobacter nanhaiticus]